MSQAMFLNITRAIFGDGFRRIRFARSSISMTVWGVSTISTTGMSVYCLMMVAWRPLAMIMSAP